MKKFLFLFTLLSIPCALTAETPDFLREDWTVTYEPTHPTYWGVEWGERNLMLPHRILVRGKHYIETRFADNWKFSTETGGAGGIALRFFSTALDYGMREGLVNLHHTMGHDAAAREFARDYGISGVPDKFTQIMPKPFGRELATSERQPGGGADIQSQYMVQPMQAENQFTYETGKNILAENKVSSTQMLSFILYRIRFLQDYLSEIGTLNQDYADSLSSAVHPALSTPTSPDAKTSAPISQTI